MQKIPFAPSLKSLASEMLLSAFSLLQTIRSLPFQSMRDGMYICVNMAIQVHGVLKGPQQVLAAIITRIGVPPP